jgi:oxygen-independent coproporphyrinogen-3 oxidase
MPPEQMTQATVLPPPAQLASEFGAPLPLALYVHVPWCVRKCPYCDFNSHQMQPRPDPPLGEETGPKSLDEELERRYLEALIADLEYVLPSVWGRAVHSIFIGGGTPSLLSARAVDSLLGAIRARLRLEPDAEITLEANPGTFEAGKFAEFRVAGVNRLSIGIQSFNPSHLRALGRVHDAQEARAAIETARRQFDNFNLDMMYALPGQSLEQALADVKSALEYEPPHLSAYHLTIEPNTRFHRQPPKLPDDDTAADMQVAIEQLAARRGYRHYETSAFALPGRESRHNLNYWTFGDYLGIGAGAHGKLSFAGRVVREARWKHPREYMERALAGAPVHSVQDIAPASLPFEFMMNALRLTGGFELRLFAERTGLPLNAALAGLERAQQLGLVQRDHARARPTLRGQRFLNNLLQLFLP